MFMVYLVGVLLAGPRRAILIKNQPQEVPGPFWFGNEFTRMTAVWEARSAFRVPSLQQSWKWMAWLLERPFSSTNRGLSTSTFVAGRVVH